jgi:hypothetical protein
MLDLYDSQAVRRRPAAVRSGVQLAVVVLAAAALLPLPLTPVAADTASPTAAGGGGGARDVGEIVRQYSTRLFRALALVTRGDQTAANLPG